MVTKDIICITCPQGCIIKVTGDAAKGEITSCEGFKCKRGKVYAENEFIKPLRILTSSVKTVGAAVPLVAVRTSAPIPKDMQMAAMEEIKKLTVSGKLVPGDVIVENFMGTGADLVASGSLE
jgi:CxxC motif-containing protein